ncbi:DNA-directed RNA polymerase V subunit 5A isoform X1 [Aristolochia californica]|uniref:DNA-directed RNA polymerase V subunit 5A isoform X1 n=1 Tax=Aristolochia californica TaxID=171875 RepID=UPI0035DDD012
MDTGSCICNYVDDGSVESHRYYLARRTLMEMLQDRGYDVDASEINLSLLEFRTRYGQVIDPKDLKFSTSLVSDPSKKVYKQRMPSKSTSTMPPPPLLTPSSFIVLAILVIFFSTDVVKLSAIRDILADRQNITPMIFVLQNKMTPQAKQATIEWKFKIELFQITDLLMNITKHILKPCHEILSPEEKQKLLTKYSLEDKQLPCMLQSDAIARYYGLEKGQVVKVMYDGDITDSHVTYRCVV